MSGIAAVLNLDDRPADNKVIRLMSSRLARRGPDNEDIFTEGGTAILQRSRSGDCRLLNNGEHVIAFDGWIDNREELLDRVQGDATWSDVCLLGALYRKFGADCFARICGDFAALIWDRNARTLLCARDPFAMKPLYYWHGGSTFVCASELRALLVHPDIRRVPDEVTVAELLNWFGYSRTNTLFKNVQRLNPGHCLSVSRRGLSISPYWTGSGIGELRLRSDAEYGEAFRDVLTTSIRSRIRNHSRVGIRLSGGLDSSTVLALAAGVVAPQAVRAYSVIEPNGANDETPYVDAACTFCGVQSTKIRPALIDVDDLLQSAAEYDDFPDYPNGAPSDSLKRAVHDDGTTVLLTGVGGDDWFFGSPLEYADLIRRFALVRLIRTWRENRDVSEIYQSGIVPLISPRFRRTVNRTLGRHTAPPWITEKLAAYADLYKRSQPVWDTTAFSGYSQRATLARATNHLETHLIELEERSEWRFGFAQRHPFFDRRVVEFALSLPQQQKQRQAGKYKYITRHAMRGKLPPQILTRVDSPSGVPTIRQFLLHPQIASMIQDLRIAESGWVVPGVVSDMYRHLQSGEIPAAHVLALWRIVGLEAWARVALS